MLCGGENTCCVDKESGQLVVQNPDSKVQLTHYSHHDLKTDEMADPMKVSAVAGEDTGDTGGSASPLRQCADTAATKTDKSPNVVPQTDSQQPLPFKVDGNTVKSIDPPEKSRIIGVMKSFASKAFNGIDAFTVGSESGEIQPIRYVLSNDLSTLTLNTQGKPSLTCNIAALTGFCRGPDAQRTLQTSPAYTVDNDVLKRLVVLQCLDRSLYIVEASEEEAEQLLTAIWVLRSYNQQKSKGAIDVSGISA